MTAFNQFCREVSFKILDKGLLETFGPYAILTNFVGWSARISTLTSGYIFHYSFLILFGLSGLLIMNFIVLEHIALEFFFLQFCFLVAFILKFDVARVRNNKS